MKIPMPQMNRRRLMQLGAGAVFVSAIPVTASATPEDMQTAIREHFGDRPINEGRVNLDLPPLAENGYSVPLTVSVESPMTRDDYVKQVAVFSPVNPIPKITTFYLGPRSGKAEVSTRVRLGGTQTVRAVAELSDNSLWIGTATTLVTLAACVLS